jgi:HK97 family phage portal protein
MSWITTADEENRAGQVPLVKNQPIGYTVLSGYSGANVSVNENSALTVAAFFDGIRIVSETIGTLPLNVYERTEDDGRKLALNHPAFDLLHDSPNYESTAAVVRAGLQAQSMLHGNSFAEIEWNDPDTRDFPVAIWPLAYDAVNAWRDQEGNLFYRIQPISGAQVDMDPRDILHYRGLAFDGFWGKSVLQMARESLGLGIVYDRHAGKFFGNGSRPGVVIKHPGRLGEEAVKRLREGWERIHQGVENTAKVAILEEGMDVSAYSINNDDAQFLESRKFTIEEVARWLNISLNRLRVSGATAFTNPEDDAIDYVVNTIRPWMVRIEQENNKKLFPNKRYFCEHQVEGLLRGNIAARYQSYAVARNWGWFSVNDIRKLENLPAIDGGETYMQPLNMASIGQATGGTSAAPTSPTLGVVTPGAPVAPLATEAPKPEVQLPQDQPTMMDSQATALNGAQVTSLLEIVLQVGQGLISVLTAKALAEAAFPSIDKTILNSIFDNMKINPTQPIPSTNQPA